MKKHPPQRSKPAPQRGGHPRRGGGAPTTRPESDIPRSWRAIVGTHAIREALQVSTGLQRLWLRQGWESSQELRDFEEMARKNRIAIELKQVAVLDRLHQSHQGAVLYASTRPTLDFAGLENFSTSVVLALDGIEDPHNLGAILRTAWLTGAHGILTPAERAVGLTPTVHKVACGGAEHVPVEEVNSLVPSLERLKEAGYWVFGLSHKSTKTIFDLQLPEKVVWAVGAEDKGLRGTTERLCDDLVGIPQLSNAASYNASVATAMALTETLRQHRHRKS